MSTFGSWIKAARTKNDLEQSLTREVNRLLTVYRDHTGAEAMAGGCQHLMLRPQMDVLLLACKSDALFSLASATFPALPASLKLYIFSYLHPTELCTAAMVYREWNLLCEDELLWRRILERKQRKWQSISSPGNPDFYRRVAPQMQYKEIYLRCHPASPFLSWNNSSAGQSSLYRLSQFVQIGWPKVVMFGPGLDTGASRILRSILTDQQMSGSIRRDCKLPHLRFEVTGMIPGEFAGIGSGISMRLCEHQFHLITLYSNVRAVRGRTAAGDRVEASKLFERSTSDGPRAMHVVNPAIQQLMRKAHAAVFVIDGSRPAHEVALCAHELEAMMCGIWTSDAVPLLVLVCSSRDSQDDLILPAVDVVRALRLGRLNRLWMSRSGNTETLDGIREGFDWLIGQVGALARIL